jgi:Protein of unknown function (DUF3667)
MTKQSEPQAEKGTSQPKPAHCRNCGHAWDTNEEVYCSKCSQKRLIHLDMGHIVHEFVHNTLHLDGKFFRMLHHLFIPGRVTNDFLAGKQKKYPHPVRFFIIISALFLLTYWKFVAPSFHEGFNGGGNTFLTQQVYDQALGPTISYSLRTEAFWSDSVRQAQNSFPDTLKAAFLKSVFGLKRDSLFLKMTQEGETAPGINFVSSTIPVKDVFVMHPDSLLQKYETDTLSTFERFAARQAIKLTQSPSDFGKAYIGNFAFSFLFLLILQAGVMKLLFVRRKRLYAEHFIFLMNIATTLLLSLVCLFVTHSLFPEGWLGNVFGAWLLGVLVFTYMSLRSVYKQSWMRTFGKFAVFSFVYFFLALVVSVFSAVVIAAVFG